MQSRVLSPESKRNQLTRTPMVEHMEQRILFAAAPRVTSITPDNRGEVMITFDTALDATTVKSTNVQIHTAGTDGVFGTADDVKIDGIVRLKTANRRIWWRPRVPVPFQADTTYSVKVSGKNVKAADGITKIDGEFNGPGIASGDGVGGGDLLFLAKRDKGVSPTARFSTVEGNIDVSLDTVNTPATYANFLHYADNGLYDYSFSHRSVSGFIWQGGGFNVNINTNDMHTIATTTPVVNEFHTSNTRGTIAMAKLGGQPNSATDQWFFNEADNSGTSPNGLDFQNSGFTVFGSVKNASGLAVMDQIAALSTDVLHNAAHDPEGLSTPDVNNQTVLDETPVINTPSSPAALDPINDLMVVRRIAILDKFVAFPIPT